MRLFPIPWELRDYMLLGRWERAFLGVLNHPILGRCQMTYQHFRRVGGNKNAWRKPILVQEEHLHSIQTPVHKAEVLTTKPLCKKASTKIKEIQPQHLMAVLFSVRTHLKKYYYAITFSQPKLADCTMQQLRCTDKPHLYRIILYYIYYI